ncbi:MAG: laccase domain-containing protein, partial [Burkholderiaceae bacterium]
VDHAHPGAGSEQGKDGRHGVVARTLSALQSLTGQTSEALVGDLCVWLGPCIGPQAFEVGEEVRAAFIARHAEDACYFVPQGKPDPSSNPSLRGDQAQGSRGMTATKYLADLPGLARAELARLGVRAVSGNDGGAAWCTVANAKAYFSYRRDQSTLGGSGRMAALVWLTG